MILGMPKYLWHDLLILTKVIQDMKNAMFPLSMAKPGERVRIVMVRAGASVQERLLSMGLNVDDMVLVAHSQHRGSVVISRCGQKYGLGGGMAQKIFVMKEQ